MFITLLGWELLGRRKAAFEALREAMEGECARVGERVLASPHNPISMALSLGGLTGGDDRKATQLGSMLFSRGVSGARVVPTSAVEEINCVTFKGFGSHTEVYPHGPYLTVAAAVGMTLGDVEVFAQRLQRTLQDFQKWCAVHHHHDTTTAAKNTAKS